MTERVATQSLAVQTVDLLKAHGIDHASGVPCSLLGQLIEAFDDDPSFHYLPAVREDTALGLAGGIYLGGRHAAVLMQNSGLGYSLNVLTSLNAIYKIPTLLFISYRGFGGKDAPEHLVMGATCEAILTTIGVPYRCPEPGEVLDAVEWAIQRMQDTSLPAAVLVKKGIYEKH